MAHHCCCPSASSCAWMRSTSSNKRPSCSCVHSNAMRRDAAPTCAWPALPTVSSKIATGAAGGAASAPCALSLASGTDTRQLTARSVSAEPQCAARRALSAAAEPDLHVSRKQDAWPAASQTAAATRCKITVTVTHRVVGATRCCDSLSQALFAGRPVRQLLPRCASRTARTCALVPDAAAARKASAAPPSSVAKSPGDNASACSSTADSPGVNGERPWFEQRQMSAPCAQRRRHRSR